MLTDGLIRAAPIVPHIVERNKLASSRCREGGDGEGGAEYGGVLSVAKLYACVRLKDTESPIKSQKRQPPESTRK